MALKLREKYPDHNIINVMANTSKERKESLEFMDKCDKHFGLNLVWIEAVINQEKGKGTDFKVVRFEDLNTNGEIFEDGIKKYGIPCKINKWCNRELKLVPLKKYGDSIFGKKNYSIAVGVRSDEIDRVSCDYATNNIFYPLVDDNITKKCRNIFWSKQEIKIKIPAYKGNCDLCFEKSNRKLCTIIKEDKELTGWWDDMEIKYSKVTIDGKAAYNSYVESGGIYFYRENRSVINLFEMTKKPFRKATDEYIYESDLFDYEGGCGSGCQVF
jgi:hypothetical protein